MSSNLYLIIKYRLGFLYKRMHEMKCFCFFIFFVFIESSHAQELHFENLSLKGLPSTEVYEVFQDSNGFIWMATDAGICKYDGNTLTTFTVKDGIPENVVLKIKEDAKKRVWFNTLSGYFFYYENGHFKQIAANPNLKKHYPVFPYGCFFIGENDTLFIFNTGFFFVIKKKN